MNKLVAAKCDIMLATDQNIDYCKVDTSSSASDLLDIFTTLGTLPTVTIPTRVTHCSATLIDNIYIKSDKYENINSRTIITDISDHYPIITCMGRRKAKVSKEPLVFQQRMIGPEQINKVSTDIKNTHWDQNMGHKTVNECHNAFIDRILNTGILNTHAPTKIISIPYMAILREPWMTAGLLKKLTHKATSLQKHTRQRQDT